MGRWTAESADDYRDTLEHFDRTVEYRCPCGSPVRVPYVDGPPIGPVRCHACQASHPVSKWREMVRQLK